MTENISEQDIRNVAAEMKHPAIDCALVDL